VPSVAEFLCQVIERRGAFNLRLLSLTMSLFDDINVETQASRLMVERRPKRSGVWQGRPFTRVGTFASEFEFSTLQAPSCGGRSHGRL